MRLWLIGNEDEKCYGEYPAKHLWPIKDKEVYRWRRFVSNLEAIFNVLRVASSEWRVSRAITRHLQPATCNKRVLIPTSDNLCLATVP